MNKRSSKKSGRTKAIPTKQTADQGLALKLDVGLSDHQYCILFHRMKRFNLYPSLDSVSESKCRCYSDDIGVTETRATVGVQSLIDHTVKRLCKTLDEVFVSKPTISEDVTILIKWGYDGAGHCRYNQQYSDPYEDPDENIFSFSIVPMQMNYINKKKEKIVIWQNPAPSSVRYCRPIKLFFTKETAETIGSEIKSIEEEISLLTPVMIKKGGKNIRVEAKLIYCLVDDQVCNSQSAYKSSKVCFLCGATSLAMNDKNALTQNEYDELMLSFAISPLHAWIRFMECLLHISYRLEFKEWQPKSAELEAKLQERKRGIQKRFENEMGLLVDVHKENYGDTNDRYAARKFFQNAEKSAAITKINIELIKRFHIILECLQCGFAINSDAFNQYVAVTRQQYLAEYAWFHMPLTVHMVLFHGETIIRYCTLPIGLLSDKARKFRNADNRNTSRFELEFKSRLESIKDVLHNLFETSDPYINTFRQPLKFKRRTLKKFPDIKTILHSDYINDENSESDEEADAETYSESDSESDFE